MNTLKNSKSSNSSIHTVTLIPGDGVGPEIVEVVRKCIESTGINIKWEVVEAGKDIIEKEGTPLPKAVFESLRKNKVGIKGPITTPVGKGFRSVNVSLRKQLNLYACVRPCKSYLGIPNAKENIDIVIIRENTEDLYAGVEFEVKEESTLELIKFIESKGKGKINKDSGISIKPISKCASERIAKFAFEYAIKNKRKKVTAVHKANIMKFSDGLFLETFYNVAHNYPQIEAEDKIVDNMCMQLVQKPEKYDILVLPNLYGDIISDLCAGLIGGLGVAPGANIGDDIALFEPTHGSAPKYKGLNKVNPTAIILSGVMLLKHINEYKKASILEKAVSNVIKERKAVTYDLKGVATTSQMGETIEKEIKRLLS